MTSTNGPPPDVQAKAASLSTYGDAALRRVLDSATDHAVIATDLDRRIALWSDGARGLFGWTETEVLGHRCDLIFTPEDRAAGTPEAEVATVLAEGRAVDDRWHARRDGSRFWGNGWIAPLRGPGDGAVGFVKVLRDGTAERMAEQRLRLALELAGSLAWEMDPATGLSTWDAGAVRLLGLPAGVMPLEDALEVFVHPEDLEAVRGAMAHALDPAGGGGYRAEHRVVGTAAEEAAGGVLWFQSLGQAWFEGTGAARAPVRLVCVSMDVTLRRGAEERRRLLVNELNHRVKNTLATVQSLARQTGRSALSPTAFLAGFESRLLALARAHDLLTQEDWTGATVGEVARGALSPHLGEGRIAVQGPSLRVEPRAAVALAMALGELSTNAVKYGALSVPGGRVEVTWAALREEPGRATLTWRESGGPTLPAPSGAGRAGFGTRLLTQGLRGDLGTGAELDFAQGGLRCVIRFPFGA
jgi:PAS domain S-box-containing protein